MAGLHPLPFGNQEYKAVNSGGGVCVCVWGGALLSIPHETQWTIQALPTALSVQQQYQR